MKRREEECRIQGAWPTGNEQGEEWVGTRLTPRLRFRGALVPFIKSGHKRGREWWALVTSKLLVRHQVAMSLIQETTGFQHLVYIMSVGRNCNLMDRLQSLRTCIFINIPNDSDAGSQCTTREDTLQETINSPGSSNTMIHSMFLIFLQCWVNEK